MDAPTGGATLLQELVNMCTLEQTGPGRFGQTLIHAVLEGVVLIRKPINRKVWLVLVALLCMVPGTYATKSSIAPRCGEHGDAAMPCRQVPEGGSATVYLLGAGITCLGAMFIRYRVSKPSLS
jgi:hypothetical protein